MNTHLLQHALQEISCSPLVKLRLAASSFLLVILPISVALSVGLGESAVVPLSIFGVVVFCLWFALRIEANGSEPEVPSELSSASTELAAVFADGSNMELRRELEQIVRAHSKYAAGSALIPVPGIDMLFAAAIITSMYTRINRKLGLALSEGLVKAIAGSVATNIMTASSTFLVLGSGLKFIPGLGSFGGGALMATTVYGVTFAAGVVYLNAIEKLTNEKPANEINESELRRVTEELGRDRSQIHELLASARRDYRGEVMSNRLGL